MPPVAEQQGPADTPTGPPVWGQAPLGGYYTFDQAGLIVWVQGTMPETGGHWVARYAAPDGSWANTEDAQHSIRYDVWAADGSSAAASGGSGADDWISQAFPDMPESDRAEIRAIFTQESDPARAAQRALAYVRSTAWWAAKYPGFNDGFSKGMFSDERGYRQLLNDYNQVYRQYMNRDISGTEMAQYLADGVGPGVVGQRFQGAAIVQAQSPEWDYVSGAFDTTAFTGAEKTALGQEQAGLDSPLGQLVMKRLQQAQARLQAIFSGQVGTPNFGLGPQGLQAASLSRNQAPDIPA